MLTSTFPEFELNQKGLIWHYQATIPADVTSISPIVEQLMKLAERTECFAGKEMEIETAVREALANAIVHGCKNDERKTVQLSIACDEDFEVQIVVRNPGSGFDPDLVPDPTDTRHVYQSHGRGLYLINQLMDEVRYERGGTQIRMRKR